MDELIGKQGRDFRKKKIKALLDEVRVSRKWKTAFISRYPVFDSIEGHSILSMGSIGKSDEPHLLICAQDFVNWVKETQPEWYTEALKKQSNEQEQI